ncbi:PREDICTED: atrial natriuretic peptide receptor 3-like [Priapulus caudatus]|uniref:Atrial natriuretic peptide receptor 3-like n=1 Tax=Priapulus caudatus TaxID=37621 RepID=A0ABM1EBY2_PRICU|nr:PREDICTED: atrial natriuretic peptide receptor 3-like [Priapulus caudatus]
MQRFLPSGRRLAPQHLCAMMLVLAIGISGARSRRTSHVGSGNKELVQISCILPNNTHMYAHIPRVRPALDIANDYIVRHRLLPDHQLDFTYADSRCSPTYAQIEAIDFYMKGKTRAFFGPVCDYAAAAIGRINWHWDIPLLTPGALVQDFGENKTVAGAQFPMVTRVGASFDSMSGFVVTMMTQFGWRRVKGLYERHTNTEVMDENFCYLAMNALYAVIARNGLPIGTDEGSTFFEMPTSQDKGDVLRNEVGVKYAGK